MEMFKITVQDSDLAKAAAQGMDEFIAVFTDAIYKEIGELTAGTMARLNSDQITLLAYCIMRDEVMDGGFVELIHNGYGPFIFINPFYKALDLWGMADLSILVKKARKLFYETHKEIEKDCTDEEFMALFEQFPQFDDLDDEFVENEEDYTKQIAYYIDEHIGNFAEIEGTTAD